VAEQDLIDLYRQALYVVQLDERELILRIGQPEALLDELLEAAVTDTAAFMTACNPASVPLTDAENASRQVEFKAAITAAGYTCYAGEGRAPAGDWQPEESFLILGLDRSAANALAQRFGQNAYVWLEKGLPPELALTPT
jgi:hypothetical protein